MESFESTSGDLSPAPALQKVGAKSVSLLLAILFVLLFLISESFLEILKRLERARGWRGPAEGQTG